MEASLRRLFSNVCDDMDGAEAEQVRLLETRLMGAGFPSMQALSQFMAEGTEPVVRAVFGDTVHPDSLGDVVEKVRMGIEVAAEWERRTKDRVRDKRLADVLEVLQAEAKARKTDEERARTVSTETGLTRTILKARCSFSRGEGSNSLKAVDDADWAKWASRAVDLLKRGVVPSLESAEQSQDPEATMQALLGSARANTLRLRVRPWEAFVRWLEWRRGRTWPATIVDVVDSVAERQAEKPTGTFPTVMRCSLAWFEARSGFPTSQRLTNSDQLKLYFDKMALDAGAMLDSVRRAPRFPLVVVAAMERMVVESTGDLSTRRPLIVVIWARLLKLYGSLRTDDLQRLRPDMVTYGESGFVGRLLRTKCSGPGKRVQEFLVFIPEGTGIRDPRWLRTGYDLWREMVRQDTDFFLPRPLASWESFSPKLATSSDLAQIFTHAMLTVFSEGEGVLEEPLTLSSTGHSDRSTLQSWLAILGVPKSEREFMGRWSASGADDYVRTYRAMVRRLLDLIKKAVANKDAYSIFDEAEAIE